MDEKRKEQRYSVREDTFVWNFREAHFRRASVEDVSRSGMRLRCDYDFTQGTQIGIDLKGVIICGTVRYCTPVESGFAVGIRVNYVGDDILASLVQAARPSL